MEKLVQWLGFEGFAFTMLIPYGAWFWYVFGVLAPAGFHSKSTATDCKIFGTSAGAAMIIFGVGGLALKIWGVI